MSAATVSQPFSGSLSSRSGCGLPGRTKPRWPAPRPPWSLRPMHEAHSAAGERAQW